MYIVWISHVSVLFTVAPLAMLGYASLLVTTSDPASVSVTTALSTATSVWYLFGLVRVFRAVSFLYLLYLIKVHDWYSSVEPQISRCRVHVIRCFIQRFWSIVLSCLWGIQCWNTKHQTIFFCHKKQFSLYLLT